MHEVQAFESHLKLSKISLSLRSDVIREILSTLDEKCCRDLNSTRTKSPRPWPLPSGLDILTRSVFALRKDTT
jgi:hypothetical protein